MVSTSRFHSKYSRAPPRKARSRTLGNRPRDALAWPAELLDRTVPASETSSLGSSGSIPGSILLAERGSHTLRYLGICKMFCSCCTARRPLQLLLCGSAAAAARRPLLQLCGSAAAAARRPLRCPGSAARIVPLGGGVRAPSPTGRRNGVDGTRSATSDGPSQRDTAIARGQAGFARNVSTQVRSADGDKRSHAWLASNTSTIHLC